MTAKLYSGGIAEAVDHSNVRPKPYQLSPVASRGDLKKLYTILATKNIKPNAIMSRSEEHTSELQSRFDLVCRLLLEKKKKRSARNIETGNKPQREHHILSRHS